MNNQYILAIDQGTTSSRAIIYDMNYKSIAISQQPITQIYPQEGWVEHDPLEIWNSQFQCCKNAIQSAGISVESIRAIGVTNQRETIVAWDKITGKPLYNAIVWQDRRTANSCAIDEIKIGLENNRHKTGLNIDAYFSASKIRWLLENISVIREKALQNELCIGTIDSWLIWNLTNGKLFVTDYSNASRTNLFNIQTLKWDEELLSYYQIPQSVLSAVVDTMGQIGYCEVFGGNIPITAIAGDQQAALFGHGCTEVGMTKNTFGTGCFLLQNIGNQFKLSKHHLLTTIAWKKDSEICYAIEGSVFNAGTAITWLKDNLGLFSTYEEAETLCQSVINTDNVFFVPAFTGLGAPYWDMNARGTVVGIHRNTTKSHIIRATYEAIAYQCKDLVDTLEKDSQAKINSLQIDGGLSRSLFLRQILADILNIPIITNQSDECTALGIAMMAAKSIQWEMNPCNNPIMTEPKLQKNDLKKNYFLWRKAVEKSKNWIEF